MYEIGTDDSILLYVGFTYMKVSFSYPEFPELRFQILKRPHCVPSVPTSVIYINGRPAPFYTKYYP